MNEGEKTTEYTDDSEFIKNLKEAIERERKKRADGLPNALELLESELAGYERDKADPPKRWTAGSLAFQFGCSRRAVKEGVEEGRIEVVRTEVIYYYYVRQSEVDRICKGNAYHRGKRFVIWERKSEMPNLPEAIVADTRNRIQKSGYTVIELKRPLTVSERVELLEAGFRLLPGSDFNSGSFQEYLKSLGDD